MRTTLTLEEPIAATLKNAAHRSGKAFKQIVNETLRAGLKASAQVPRPYRLEPASLGGVLAPVELDKALQLIGVLDGDELQRKLQQRE